MAFLTILEDEETFEYSPVDPATGQRMESVFVLRLLPEDVLKDLRRQHTKTVFEAHQRVERLDDMALGRAIVDYAVVDWRGIKSARSEDDLPCTPDLKAKLPEVVKADVVRLCAGKEAGSELSKAAQEKKPSKPISSGSKTTSGT